MKYEQGKWYWVEFPNERSYIARITGTTVCFSEYALIVSEFYSDNGVGHQREEKFLEKFCTGPATPAQIEQCLKAYAEKNGYVEGVDIICPVHNDKWVITGSLSYDTELDMLESSDGDIVYYRGKWAELVKDPETKEDLQIHCKTDDWGNYQLDSVHVTIRDKRVSIKELVSVYQHHLDIKTIIG